MLVERSIFNLLHEPYHSHKERLFLSIIALTKVIIFSRWKKNTRIYSASSTCFLVPLHSTCKKPQCSHFRHQCRYGTHFGTDYSDLSNNVGKLGDRWCQSRTYYVIAGVVPQKNYKHYVSFWFEILYKNLYWYFYDIFNHSELIYIKSQNEQKKTICLIKMKTFP